MNQYPDILKKNPIRNHNYLYLFDTFPRSPLFTNNIVYYNPDNIGSRKSNVTALA